mmetsp:Transcript_34684/g.92906  ORF Transcript_34684/g.92906 Transcript_34684/m.92906 type:complete len:237 (-) Transcript_34684:381-1091(-)
MLREEAGRTRSSPSSAPLITRISSTPRCLARAACSAGVAPSASSASTAAPAPISILAHAAAFILAHSCRGLSPWSRSSSGWRWKSWRCRSRILGQSSSMAVYTPSACRREGSCSPMRCRNTPTSREMSSQKEVQVACRAARIGPRKRAASLRKQPLPSAPPSRRRSACSRSSCHSPARSHSSSPRELEREDSPPADAAAASASRCSRGSRGRGSGSCAACGNEEARSLSCTQPARM